MPIAPSLPAVRANSSAAEIVLRSNRLVIVADADPLTKSSRSVIVTPKAICNISRCLTAKQPI